MPTAASSKPVPKLVVVDRDGVINRESAHFIRSPEQWIPLAGSLEAIASLTRAGFNVVVASNQSGVGRGLFSAATLEAIDQKLVTAVEGAGGNLGGIFVCPHAPGDDCDCRKPRPCLLHQIERAFGVQANSISVLVNESFQIPMWVTGSILTVLTAVVILGGIKSIARVCEGLVPFMAITYACLAV